MNDTLNRVAMALLIDYTSVYYVDLKTNHYECFSTNQGYQNLELQSSGEDFFADCQRDIREVIYEEDWDKISAVLTKENLLREFRDSDKIDVVYRLMIDGRQVYHTMRILHQATDTDDCIILGVLNVDSVVRNEQATKTYNAIAKTLASRYTTIYYIDLSNDHYIEYSSSVDYKDLEIPPEGEAFFAESRANIQKLVHPDDLERVLDVFTKEYFVRETLDGRRFFIEYRLLMNGEYHHIRVGVLQPDRGVSLIITLEGIDNEVREKEEMAKMNERSAIFTNIAESLASQYGMIYYIDAETDEYIEFTATNEYKEFNISPTGNDFFGTSQRNVSMIVYGPDREKVFDALNKKNMLQRLNEKGSYTITYQLLMAEGTSHTRMSVFWANDKKHLIMGIMNIDNEIRKENAMKKMLAENAVFAQIAESLANQYDTIYYIDMLSDSYMEFASTDVYKSLEVRPSGDDFFGESRKNVDRVVYPEDREAFARLMNKPTLVQMLQDKHMLTHTYRLIIGDGIMYARMSIMWATDNKHVIIGVMNIDKEIRREQEVQEKLHVANEKAYRDELTGVKNKGAYKEHEADLDRLIAEGVETEFALVVCDVNGLKAINDRLGHIAGDALIKNASDLICRIWSHSPVFRIGGDEFAIVAQGRDYDIRYRLLDEMKREVVENQRRGEVVIASGMAEYVPGTDPSVSTVFERADNLMYHNKAELKGNRGF